MLAAPRIGAARRRALRRSRPAAPAGRRFAHFVLDLFRAGPLRSSGRPTRHSPPEAPFAPGHCAAAGDQHATRRHSPPHGDIGVALDVAADCAWFPAHAPEFAAAPYGTERPAEKGRRLPLWRRFCARARGARRWRRELGGGVRQHPGSTTALRGLMASLALRSARPWRAMRMPDRPAGCAWCARRLCGALRGSGRPPRGGRRRSFVGGDRLLVANGRCWRRRELAPRAWVRYVGRYCSAGWAALRPFRFRFIPRRATAQQRATNTPLAATARRHSPPHGDIGVVLGWWLLTASWFWLTPPNSPRRLTALTTSRKGAAFTFMAPIPRARARGARRWRRELGVWCATAPRF